MSWPKFDSKIAGQMNSSSFGSRVSKGSVLAESTNPKASYRGRNDNARAGLFSGILLKKWGKSDSISCARLDVH